MSRAVRAVFVCAATLAAALPAAAASLCQVSQCEPDGQQSSGAVYRVCMPEASCWNGDLVIWAHGYVDPNQPVGIPEDQLVLDGVSLPALVNALGFGFATTSYSSNGLAVLQGVQDVTDLVGVFSSQQRAPGHVYLVGASEGGLVTALGVEQRPDVFAGGLATCGPVGWFQGQLQYLGDFRTVFDVYFPGVIPGPATAVPPYVMASWNGSYVPAIQAALAANPAARDQLLAVTHAPYDPANPATKDETILGLLWYDVFATNDAATKLGGNPYGNRYTIYTGSSNDLLLNLLVHRYASDPAATTEVRNHYETSGKLSRPVVSLHTTGDPIIPYAHETLYDWKVAVSGSSALHDDLPVSRYGHCQFTAAEALVGFIDLLIKAGAQQAVPQGLAGNAAGQSTLLKRLRDSAGTIAP